MEKVLAVVPKRNPPDRVLFTLVARTGVRAEGPLRDDPDPALVAR
ncbi:hypothetical protein GCM10010399_90000 [Dactylosporangium fulvum]|uniref:Uncharacterized protein n=1 Tax=Dactylosporangium fulvum TaxID=53359 RepID=A0ABY5WC50_9ACTN|nr:hypothetical protein [Dactylosporangium fulvum]UWP85676.1 hypothetical protein Dfulv_16115 [Dactylosporangium fulvum]